MERFRECPDPEGRAADHMRIVLTGATGYIGAAVLDGLIRAGHEVTALARSGASAAQVKARGATALTGDLASPEAWRDGAAGHEAYVHAAFESSARAAQLEMRSVETLLALAAATPPAAVLYTSGVWVLGPTTGPVSEDAPLAPPAITGWRPAVEQKVLDGARHGVRTIVVRPGMVYGGGRGIVSDMLTDGDNGLMRIIGSGDNHWSLVYDRDLADLYVKLLAAPEASGVFHATDDNEQPVRVIVEAIADQLPSRPDVRHMPLAEARQKLGPMADALAMDQQVRSPRARALGWTPTLGTILRNMPRLFEEWRNARQNTHE
jgi:nucleoside-diphosphate-sugar epimerase